ncbi:helix-turn-helix domain-containing protein [Allotamlana fucoidanivorans]|uniref:helix-turn-helix domain-containing protein n=1 Tax=Allotamlana fucoidanivorans TaxID=2583814 RepID=UPI001E28DB77|nr:helix-turn-helix transcriptional regulator [Tamlana fucoidanivorans]
MKIKYLRNELFISQEELAHRSELHRTYISSVELGKRNISIRNIEKLAKALEVNIIELFKD